VLADQKSLDLRTLLENARSTDNASNQDVIRYRREAELNVGSDEHLYRVDWVSYYKACPIVLMLRSHTFFTHRISSRRRCGFNYSVQMTPVWRLVDLAWIDGANMWIAIFSFTQQNGCLKWTSRSDALRYFYAGMFINVETSGRMSDYRNPGINIGL
jgi:hypothetical protein